MQENEQRRLTVAEQYEQWRFERLPLDERLTIVTNRAIANVKQRIDEIFADRSAIRAAIRAATVSKEGE